MILHYASGDTQQAHYIMDGKPGESVGNKITQRKVSKNEHSKSSQKRKRIYVSPHELTSPHGKYSVESDSNEDIEPTQPTTTYRSPTANGVVKPIRTFVPSIADEEFRTWDEFFEFWEQYEKTNLVSYRTRDSRSTDKFNLTKNPAQRIPRRFDYAFRKYACTLGCMQKSRSQGKRARRSSRFHGCIASFRAVVTLSNRDPSQWVVKIVHEERCHNHRLTEALYVTLKRSKDLIDDSILEKLDAFVETNTNTKQITDYVATRLGLPITSQRIRNLINARLGSTDTEQRLKMLIDKFIAQDGNQCLLIQNEWDLTCGIVIQSIAQKAVYERWSENLVLDWTHSTNNLGFYLGSLIATVADGRGVSVLDFLCMNQQKETLKAVLSFFKSNNPNWAHLESLVIDKDFTEWSTLQEVFPNATVLLCQFHAIQYMRRMLGSQKYLVPVMRRTEIEKLFRGLMYASSVTVYQHRKRSFVSRVKAISPAFANYFDRNWFSCSSMWCNYGRRCCFSAGNTTTNRVESSWNQHKQLMGKKSSIDKCLSVVFQHQVSVLRQLSNSLELFEVQAPAGPSIPTALRRLHDALSFYCFQRVRRQWDYNVVKGDKWEWHHCTEKQHDVYRLVLSMGDHVKVVWSTERCYCDCLFYASTRLPCQHLFNVMATQRDMDMFEVAQLDPRWSMARARSVLPELSQSIHHLSDVRQLKSGGDRDSSEVKLDSKRRIRYVKLKRNERCDEVVLSDCEKYNVVRAEVQSLIDEMQKLPSHEFYPRFSDLYKESRGYARIPWYAATQILT